MEGENEDVNIVVFLMRLPVDHGTGQGRPLTSFPFFFGALLSSHSVF